jgi:hypothetical protein
MKIFRILAFSAMVAIAALVGIQSNSYAVPILTLSSNSTNVTVTDNQAGDLDPTSGVIVYTGAVGNFSLNVSTGQSKPFLGSAVLPHLDLNTVDTSSTGGGTLIITFSDYYFTASNNGGYSGPIIAQAGGTTAGTVDLKFLIDTSNSGNSFTQFATLGTFGSGAFSGVVTGLIPSTTDPYGLRMEATINHPSGGVKTTSFNTELNPVPEPATLLLMGFGSGFMGFGINRLRSKIRRKKDVVV